MLRSLVVALAVMLVAASPAAAGSVAYVDGNEVWVSSFDGTQKARLSDGEGDWRAVAAADNGRVLGVRLQAGKIAQLSGIQLWEANGTVLSQGPLPYKNLAWSSYAAPVGMDLSSDGVFLAYGYSGYTGVVPNASFYSGHNVVNADTKSLIQPIGQSGYKFPTMFGRRVVAAQGTAVFAQPDGGGPFGTSWNGLLDTAGVGLDLERTDVAANGRLLAIDLDDPGPGPAKVAVIATANIDGPVAFPAAVDCFLPAVGDATDATLSQDGTRIAWKDAEGVKVGGTPTTAADPCVLSSPPVLLSATGKSPSIGGADVTALRPPAAAPVPPAGGTAPGAPGGATTPTTTSPSTAPPAAAPTLTLRLPARVTVTRLAARSGIAITIDVPAGGVVRVRGTVPAARLGLKGKAPVVVVTGTASPAAAGSVKVKLRLSARARKRAKRLRGARLTLRVTQGARASTRTITLR